jgi:hypothetical protein
MGYTVAFVLEDLSVRWRTKYLSLLVFLTIFPSIRYQYVVGLILFKLIVGNVIVL